MRWIYPTRNLSVIVIIQWDALVTDTEAPGNTTFILDNTKIDHQKETIH